MNRLSCSDDDHVLDPGAHVDPHRVVGGASPLEGLPGLEPSPEVRGRHAPASGDEVVTPT